MNIFERFWEELKGEAEDWIEGDLKDWWHGYGARKIYVPAIALSGFGGLIIGIILV